MPQARGSPLEAWRKSYAAWLGCLDLHIIRGGCCHGRHAHTLCQSCVFLVWLYIIIEKHTRPVFCCQAGISAEQRVVKGEWWLGLSYRTARPTSFVHLLVCGCTVQHKVKGGVLYSVGPKVQRLW